jgi:5-methylcytosine-specific restriction endonuclease McrA
MDSVVVLNRNFEYWTEVNLRKVLKWLVLDKIEVVVSHETEEIGSVEFRIRIPLVVRLLDFVGYKPRNERIHFSTEAVFRRDDNTCQYWHKDAHGRKTKYKCSASDRTIDHVVPESRGGRNDFMNCVCACKHCNEVVKKNRTPEEAGMELVRKPFVPLRDRNSYVSMRFAFNPDKIAHRKYREVVLGIA